MDVCIHLFIYLFVYLLHTWFFQVTFSTTNSRSLNPKKSPKEPPQKGHFEEPGSSVNNISILLIYIFPIRPSGNGSYKPISSTSCPSCRAPEIDDSAPSL